MDGAPGLVVILPPMPGWRPRHGWGTRLGGGELAEGLFDGEEAAQVDELEEAEFEVEALFLAIAQLVEGAEHDLQEAGEVFFAEEGGGACGAGALVGGDCRSSLPMPSRIRPRARVGDFGHEAVAQVADELAGELRGAVAGVEELVAARHHFCGVCRRLTESKMRSKTALGTEPISSRICSASRRRLGRLRAARRRWPGP